MSEAALPAGWPAMSIAQAHALITAPGSPAEMETVDIRGIPTRTWKNLPPSLRSIVELGRTHGEKVFLVYEDERVTYEAFYRAVSALARQLQADGVQKGDRVAVIMRNLPEWVVAFYAGASLGAIVTPLNAWWTGPELEYGLTDSGSKVVLMDAERYERLTEHLPNCPDLVRVYVSRSREEIAHPQVTTLESVLGGANEWANLPDQPLPPVDIHPDDDATIFYTSGTTGKPKGALATQRGVNSNIMAGAVAGARAFLRRGEAPPEADPNAPQRSSLISIPFFHVTGCMAVLNPSLAGGAKLVMMHKWDVIRAFELIQREKIQSAGGVPTIAWQLIEHPARANYDLSSLESVSYGGAPSAPELVRKIKETFPKSAPGNGWGMTETCATVTTHGAEDYANRPDSCGPAVPVSDLEIRDPADGVTVLGPNVVGELWARGPQVVKNYWNKPEATAQTFVDGWVRTGDLARVDEEGFCFIIDRAKDMLIRGGENIYCIEVENVLYDHPAVMDAAIVGIPHRTLGEEPAAVVTLKPGASATEEELRAHVAEHLAAFKVPVKVRFWHETLPRNPNGKILKNELKKLFVEEQA
ncbi:fatty acid--CoA ligase [Phenylobacterium sp. Root77]|jgi:long-chain acyl-CoA synthetase|uniref:class I adenylate-forming enzyme family protein n=1 Tax=unclassified Phenylobacterium TaxID=2640670 RepID=UPI0006FE7B18|nr:MULTISPECIES: class I adenylate-forming enzyme family protein [unclassified Phenylobacterium]KQW71950.1 fatty acid--CoA ligase [Phenylobacterium sp. Root1277]KQW94871.1 fatty acid--CoA ligase [Phenylobacterium sp. Root1290]KRC44565.1 fatty acid--CoA ligase [Phenylobacterium sp. Root77]